MNVNYWNGDMRNMSFALYTEQYINYLKTVTRRLGWWFLKPGDVVMGVKKGMGLKKGEKVEKLHPFQVISAWPEPLCAITQEDVIKEGFPDLSKNEFIEMFVKHNKCKIYQVVNRIEFNHLKTVEGKFVVINAVNSTYNFI